MENLNLHCSAPSELSKVLSISGIFPNDPIQYQGRSVKIDFDRLQYGDTPVLMNGQMVGVVPKQAVISSGNRVRATSGRFVDKGFASFIGQQIQTGATLQPLEMDGDVVTQARLKSFTVEPASKQYRSGSHNHPAQSGSDDDQIAESLFQASGGGPSLVAPEHDETLNRPPAQITTYGERSPAPDNDDAMVEHLFNATRGCQSAPVPQGDPEGTPAFVGSGYQDKRSDENDDDALADAIFQASS